MKHKYKYILKSYNVREHPQSTSTATHLYIVVVLDCEQKIQTIYIVYLFLSTRRFIFTIMIIYLFYFIFCTAFISITYMTPTSKQANDSFRQLSTPCCGRIRGTPCCNHSNQSETVQLPHLDVRIFPQGHQCILTTLLSLGLDSMNMQSGFDFICVRSGEKM